MRKIASPQDLQTELRRLLAYSQGPGRPSREKLAAELRSLADRIGVEEAPSKFAIKRFVGGTLLGHHINNGQSLYDFKSDSRFSLMGGDIKALVGLQLVRIQVNKPGTITLYFDADHSQL